MACTVRHLNSPQATADDVLPLVTPSVSLNDQINKTKINNSDFF